ncbi:hypothetical protein DL93DRAFT_1960413 [Clavulina sp. PMI_390]|nr:hypothetical protein DL93DRAFT_1960413 [Clavulina sp. PMI_390]
MKKKPEGKACPVCREELNPKSMHRISFKGAPTADPITVDDLLPAQRTQLHYNSIDDDILQSIKLRDSLGRFGSKIQTLIQHLLYIQDHSPGTKSIVFSAWSDSLTIVGHALDINGLKYLRNDGPKARGKVNPVQQFQTDPQYQILLLHGERDNAGLNVTAARNVFLLEPVVNHSFEVQALARVDRLGSQDSNVYCYYAEETVEKNILDLAHRRGNSLYASHPVELDTDVAGARMESTAGVKGKAAKGDFVASTEDMLEIMFPEADNPATASTSDEIGGIQDVEMEDGDSQPRAGPSRLGG